MKTNQTENGDNLAPNLFGPHLFVIFFIYNIMRAKEDKVAKLSCVYNSHHVADSREIMNNKNESISARNIYNIHKGLFTGVSEGCIAVCTKFPMTMLQFK